MDSLGTEVSLNRWKSLGSSPTVGVFQNLESGHLLPELIWLVREAVNLKVGSSSLPGSVAKTQARLGDRLSRECSGHPWGYGLPLTSSSSVVRQARHDPEVDKPHAMIGSLTIKERGGGTSKEPH